MAWDQLPELGWRRRSWAWEQSQGVVLGDVGWWPSQSSGLGQRQVQQQTASLTPWLMVLRSLQDPYNILQPKRYAGTKEDPNLVPSISSKRIVGCICE